MKKLVFFATCALLFARENPFLPGELNDLNLQSSNVVSNAKEYESQIIKFPSDARELKKIVFFYKTSSGEIKQKELVVGASFDWRDEFELKIRENPAKSASAKFDVSVTTAPVKSEQNAQKTAPVELKIEPPLKSFSYGERAKFSVYKNKIVIFTKDKLKRSFTTALPSKIAIDFRAEVDLATKSIAVDSQKVKKVTFGSHDGFYRAVIAFKARTKYQIQATKDGFEVIF